MTAEKSAEEVRIEVQRHLRFTIFSRVYDHIGQQARSLAIIQLRRSLLTIATRPARSLCSAERTTEKTARSRSTN